MTRRGQMMDIWEKLYEKAKEQYAPGVFPAAVSPK